MKKQDIIDLWKKHNIDSAPKYAEFIKSMNVSQESFDACKDILVELRERLDFDKINPKEFWSACDEVFSTDPVCNSSVKSIFASGDGNTFSVEESNRRNNKIPLHSGAFGSLDLAIQNRFIRNKNEQNEITKINIAEIGSGYGAFKLYLETTYPNLDIEYTGFDVIPRSECVESVGVDGTLTEEQVEKYRNKFDIIFSSNVFQHLSKKCVSKYVEQSYEVLKPFGYTLFLTASFQNNRCFHYGQEIDLFSNVEMNSLYKTNKLYPMAINYVLVFPFMTSILCQKNAE